MLGLGSMMGTGVFVSIGLAAGLAGPLVIQAIGLAGLVAACNALNSAQLAANHPVSGGTYEYGYTYLSPALGFTAGWMFLLAKSASAATAALGCASYLLQQASLPHHLTIPAALLIVALTGSLVMRGIRPSNIVNTVLVVVSLGSLLFFAGLMLSIPAESLYALDPSNAQPITKPNLAAAVALMFVAYTGYGRIATLGEEVRSPRRTIPRAIIAALLIAAVTYLVVAAAALRTAGANALYTLTLDRGAPLEILADAAGNRFCGAVVASGAIVAMAGVLLNLLLGLSRVVLAMGRRGDLPPIFAAVHPRAAGPRLAVLTVSGLVALLTLPGNINLTWSFSAFAVLIYYAITNLAALRLPAERRLFPRFFAWCGLAACLGLAFCIDRQFWLTGIGLIAAGWIWHQAAAFLQNRPTEPTPKTQT